MWDNLTGWSGDDEEWEDDGTGGTGLPHIHMPIGLLLALTESSGGVPSGGSLYHKPLGLLLTLTVTTSI